MTCSIEGCEKPIYRQRRGWCQMHYTRWKRHGDPLAIRRWDPSGPDHPCWKGDEIGYYAAHDRVRRVKGHAKDHLCPCGAPAQEWAYDHGDPDEKWGTSGHFPNPVPYSTDTDRYTAMCLPCHRVLDKTA